MNWTERLVLASISGVPYNQQTYTTKYMRVRREKRERSPKCFLHELILRLKRIHSAAFDESGRMGTNGEPGNILSCAVGSGFFFVHNLQVIFTPFAAFRSIFCGFEFSYRLASHLPAQINARINIHQIVLFYHFQIVPPKSHHTFAWQSTHLFVQRSRLSLGRVYFLARKKQHSLIFQGVRTAHFPIALSYCSVPRIPTQSNNNRTRRSEIWNEMKCVRCTCNSLGPSLRRRNKMNSFVRWKQWIDSDERHYG